MVGIAGGVVEGDELDEMLDRMVTEEWYESESLERDDYAIGVLHHGETAERGVEIHDGENVTGVVMGHPVDRSAAGTDESLVQRVAADPGDALPALDDSFLIAYVDDEGFHLATDRISTRMCQWTDDGQFVFGTELTSLVPFLDDPEMNPYAVAEFIASDFVYGTKTFVEGVDRVPPATVLHHVDGEVTTERYWEYDFGRVPRDGYVAELADRLRSAAGDSVASVDGTLGHLLTGGLDSRSMAAALRQAGADFRTFTFDANPIGPNPPRARRIAEKLGVRNDLLEYGPEEFFRHVEKGVRLTNGMTHWRNYYTFPFLLDEARDHVDAMVLNVGQGEYFGDWLTREELDGEPLETLATKHKKRDYAHLVDAPVDLETGVKTELERSEGMPPHHRIQKFVLDNFYPNYHYPFLPVCANQVEMRAPMAYADLLDHVTRMPPSLRKSDNPWPFDDSNDAVAPLKRALVLELDQGIEEVTSANTFLPPSAPIPLHTLSYAVYRRIPMLRPKRPHFGFLRKTHPFREWYHNDETARAFVDEKLEAAAERDLFDGATVRRLKDEQATHPFRSHIEEISAVTTLEVLMEALGIEG
ncbi:MAG: asparagine synthase-related protein [Haloferacaceae archaeon]